MENISAVGKADAGRLCELLLDYGEKMLCSGAETDRIESSIHKMGASYGFFDTEAFVIPSIIVVTVSDGVTESSGTRVVKTGEITNNLSRLQKLGNVNHVCRETHMSLDELDRRIRECDRSVPLLQLLLGSILAAGSFTVFFGGTLIDGIVSAAVALAVCLLQYKAGRYFVGKLPLIIIESFVIGCIAGFVGAAIPKVNADDVSIGNIMLIIPGLALTKSIRDIILEDTISGAIRFIESLFLTGGIALGFYISFAVTGGILR